MTNRIKLFEFNPSLRLELRAGGIVEVVGQTIPQFAKNAPKYIPLRGRLIRRQDLVSPPRLPEREKTGSN